MGYARYVGRVGGLAVALGVGVAVATTPGVAWAEPDAGTTSSESSESSPDTAAADPSTGSAGSSGDGSATVGDGSEGSEDSGDAGQPQDSTGAMQVDASGGAITSTTPGSAGATTNDDDAATTVEEPDAESAAKPTPSPSGSPAPAHPGPTATKPRGDGSAKLRVVEPTKTADTAGPSTTRITPDAQRVFDTVAVTDQPVAADTADQSGFSMSRAQSGVSSQDVRKLVDTPAPPVSDVSRWVSSVLSWVGFGPSAVADGVPSVPESPVLLAVLAWWRKESDRASAGNFGSMRMAGNPAQSSLMLAADEGSGELMALAAAVNTAPSASPSQSAPDQLTGAISGLVNGSDVDPGTTLSYAMSGAAPTRGSVSVDPATGSFTYAPTQAARLAAGATTGVDFDSFTVSVSDGQTSTPVTIQVAVLPAVVSAPSTAAQVGTNPMGVAVSPTKTYVVNQVSNTVSVIDRANPTATPVTINVMGSPTAIALSADGSRAYVAGNNAVSVVNTATNAVVGTVSLNGGGQSYGIAVAPNGQRVYVTMTGTNRVAVINTNTATNVYSLGPTVAVGSTPTGIALNADGSRAYVANWNSRNVTVLNTSTATPTVVSTITVGTNPFGVAVNADASRVYVSNHGSGTVSVLNTATNQVVGSPIAVGTQPFGITLSPDRTVLYVANGNDTVAMIDTKTNTVMRTVSIDSAPETNWHSIAVSPDGRQVYVSDMVERAVRILTINRGNTAPITGTYTVGAPNATDGAVTGVLGFRDTDGDSLSYNVVQPSTGTVTLSPAGGYTFTPNQAARDAAAASQGADFTSFTVTAGDGHASTALTVTNVEILPTPQGNRPPQAGTPSVGEPDQVRGAVSGSLNFTDPDNNPMTYSVPTQPASGTVTLDGGTYTFTPNQAARDAAATPQGPKSASITVVASDGLASASVTFSVPIAPTPPPNTAPTASPSQGAPNQTTGAITGAVNGADVDGNTLSYTLTGAAPASGSVSLNPTTGAFTYTPSQLARFAAHDSGLGPDFDSFTVSVSDGQVSTPVTVQVAVLPALIPFISNTAQTGANPMGMAVTPTKTYVANQASNTVSVIDRANPTAAPTTINVVASPRAIALSSDRTRVYVAGNGGVSVINTATNQVITTVATTAGDSYGIAVGPSVNGQHRVYVTNMANNTVRVINANTATNTYTAGASVTVGSTPVGIALSPDGNRAYVANWNSGNVTVLNTSTTTPTVVGSPIRVGTNPFGVVVSPDGTRVYVSNNGSASVSVLNPTAATPLVTTIAVDPQPFGMAISPDGSIVYAANGRDTVSMINTKTNTVYSTLIIDSQPESQWHSVAVSPDGRQVYVSDMADRTVRVATIIRGNTAPIAGTPAVDGPAASNGAMTGALNFRDTDGDALTYSVQVQPASGTVTFNNAAGTYTFTPTQAARDAAAQTQGPDYVSFTVIASDGTLATPVTVNNVRISPTPQLPQIPVTSVAAINVGDKPIGMTVAGNRLYVANSGDNTVSVIDTTTGQVVDVVPVPGYPTAMAPTTDGRYLYLANYQSVSVVDTTTHAVVATIPIPPTPCEVECWSGPAGITDLVIVGNRVYVSQLWVGDSFYTGTLSMIDTATNSVIAEGGGEWYTDLAASSDGTRIYAGVGDYRYMRVFDTQTLGSVGTASVTGPGWPVVASVNLTPDGKRGYAVVAPDMWYTSSPFISVIDTDPTSATYHNQIATITVPADADRVVFSPDSSRAYVAHPGGEMVTVIDTATNTGIGTITSDQIGGPYAALSVGSNGTLYFTNYANDKVYAVTVGSMPVV